MTKEENQSLHTMLNNMTIGFTIILILLCGLSFMLGLKKRDHDIIKGKVSISTNVTEYVKIN